MFLKKEKIFVMNEEVVIDPSYLEFNEITLSSYLQKEGGVYAYYSSKFASAEAEEAWVSIQLDKEYDELFSQLKSTGAGSDKYCESKARSDDKVFEWKKKQVAAQRNVTLLKMFLRVLDKNHENSRGYGYILQKEMDKLGNDIKKHYVDNDIEVDKLLNG
jgi:hypothetical protein